MTTPKIDHAVSQICDLGCVQIRILIGQLESGATTPETIGFDEADRLAVLAELKNIMSIYDQRK